MYRETKKFKHISDNIIPYNNLGRLGRNSGKHSGSVIRIDSG